MYGNSSCDVLALTMSKVRCCSQPWTFDSFSHWKRIEPKKKKNKTKTKKKQKAGFVAHGGPAGCPMCVTTR